MSEPDKQYNKEEFERLLFQTDNLFHNRVNILLLAETIFFVGATSAWKDWPLVLLLAFLGIATALLCTFTNLKLYWRLKWMITEYQGYSDSFKDFATYAKVDKDRWSRLTHWLIAHLAQPSGRKPRVWIDTGWLFTWGFCWVVIRRVDSFGPIEHRETHMTPPNIVLHRSAPIVAPGDLGRYRAAISSALLAGWKSPQQHTAPVSAAKEKAKTLLRGHKVVKSWS